MQAQKELDLVKKGTKKVAYYLVKSLIISNFVVLKNKTHTNMLRDKGTKNLSELKNFFTTGEKAFFAIYNTFY